MHQQKPSALSLLSMLLMLSGCVGFPERPNGHLYHIDVPGGVSYEMSVPKDPKEDVKYNGNEKPIQDMDKYFCVSPEYFLDLKFWAKDVVEYSEDRCK